MSTIVLVHGAWYGGWCWDKVVPALEGAGHEVLTPDLPGRGGDDTPVSELSMRDYRSTVLNVVDAAAEPVVLVGHSMGGIVISMVAEARPDRVERLVYLTGFLLEDGATLLSVAQNDEDAIAVPNISPSESGDTLVVGNIREVFYGDCSDEDVARAESLLVPEPALAFTTPLSISEGNFGRVPRAYVECAGDRAISMKAQRMMHERLPCETVVSMQTSHSPFFSRPEELAGHLDALSS